MDQTYSNFLHMLVHARGIHNFTVVLESFALIVNIVQYILTKMLECSSYSRPLKHYTVGIHLHQMDKHFEIHTPHDKPELHDVVQELYSHVYCRDKVFGT